MMFDRVHKIKEGIEYSSETAEVLHHRDPWHGGRRILAVTPDGHYFQAMFGGIMLGWQIFPYSRLRAVCWALENKAPDPVLERLGVTVQPEANVPPGKPYESVFSTDVLHSKKKLFKNDVLYTVEFLCQNPPDGRYFLYDGMRVLRAFLLEDYIPMTQREALLWGIKHMAPWESLEIMGYVRSLESEGGESASAGSPPAQG